MESYLNNLPTELLKEILYYISDNHDLFNLYELKEFVDIFNDHIFWMERIRYLFPEINYKYVPQYLINYKDTHILTKFANYNKLKRCYKDVKSLMEDYIYSSSLLHRKEEIDFRGYKLVYVNNFEILKPSLVTNHNDLNILFELFMSFFMNDEAVLKVVFRGIWQINWFFLCDA